MKPVSTIIIGTLVLSSSLGLAEGPGQVRTIDKQYDQRTIDTNEKRRREAAKRSAARNCPNGVFLVSKGSKWNPKIQGFNESQWRINGAYLRDAKTFVKGTRAGRQIPLLFDKTAETSRGRDCYYKPTDYQGTKAVVLSSS
jgi:hypothetical protein